MLVLRNNVPPIQQTKVDGVERECTEPSSMRQVFNNKACLSIQQVLGADHVQSKRIAISSCTLKQVVLESKEQGVMPWRLGQPSVTPCIPCMSLCMVTVASGARCHHGAATPKRQAPVEQCAVSHGSCSNSCILTCSSRHSGLKRLTAPSSPHDRKQVGASGSRASLCARPVWKARRCVSTRPPSPTWPTRTYRRQATQFWPNTLNVGMPGAACPPACHVPSP